MTTSGPDPLSPAQRAELLKEKRPRHLPVAPVAPPPKRNLPLAEGVRPIDEQWRPIYAVWEITLACDLACRHCGSRAGHARPDELSTEECLDMVRQMSEMDVKEVTIIGGEAYLRDDWVDIVREIRKRGMQATMTTGGRGITKERARQAAEAGLQSVSVSVDGTEEIHDRLRGVKGSYRSALEALTNLQEAGVRVSANTQINRLSIPHMRHVLETIAAHNTHSWQIQLTVAMGRAADEPDVLLQPYDLLDLFPMLADLKKRCDELNVRMWPGNNIGYFGPYESVLRGTMPRGHMASCGAGRSTLGIEADGSIKGCPSLPTNAWTGGNIRD
ncbi:MAG TPA: radical SAM protein, partial [Polyangiaceae bacterium]|nr:radical SAM protein [Polyangiaceae bacterium]